MSARKTIAIVLASLSVASLVCCLAISPPLLPAQPPPEYHKIQAGMHVREVKAILGDNVEIHDDDEKKAEEGIVREPGPIWMFWRVHDGSIGIMVNRREERVEMIVFQANRSSVVENVQEFFSLFRFLH
jgi:hypothetical protein